MEEKAKCGDDRYLVKGFEKCSKITATYHNYKPDWGYFSCYETCMQDSLADLVLWRDVHDCNKIESQAHDNITSCFAGIYGIQQDLCNL
jgi:hypothetical protein